MADGPSVTVAAASSVAFAASKAPFGQPCTMEGQAEVAKE